MNMGTDCLINPDLAGPYTTVTMPPVTFFRFPGRTSGIQSQAS